MQRVSLLPTKPIPTKPRVYHRLEVTRDTGSGSQLLGRRPRTPVEKGEKGETEYEQVAKKPWGMEKPAQDNEQTLATTVTAPIESSAVSPGSTNRPTKRPLVDALSHNSMDSRFLCFEGLTATWKECCLWFYGITVSSHFVWISRICWTIVDSQQLVWLEMHSNDDACKLLGYLTHRRMLDDSLVVSHFVAESTFQDVFQNCMNKWIHPAPPPKWIQDDPMEGPSWPPLEERLASPTPTTEQPSSPDRNIEKTGARGKGGKRATCGLNRCVNHT